MNCVVGLFAQEDFKARVEDVAEHYYRFSHYYYNILVF